MTEIRIKLERVDVGQRVDADPLLKGSELVRRAGEKVVAQGVAQRFKPRAALFRQGEMGDSLFFVLSGDVRLYASADREGAELGSVAAGGVVGEDGVLSGPAPRGCSAIAQIEVDAVELSRTVLSPQLMKVEPYLRELQAERHAKLKEMTEFLNRW